MCTKNAHTTNNFSRVRHLDNRSMKNKTSLKKKYKATTIKALIINKHQHLGSINMDTGVMELSSLNYSKRHA